MTSPDGRAADAAYYLMLSLGVLTVGVVGYLALRSSAAGPSHSPEDEQLLRRLIARWGATDSLAYFATRDDRSLIWDPGRRACVSYRVVSGTMLAAGDPLGPRAHWKEAIEAFLAVAQEHAWIPAVVAATRDGAQAWAKYGHLNPLEYGDEAVLHPETWSLSGREMRNVRQAVTRSERAGYSVRLRRLRDIPGDEAARLRQASDTWRAGDVERGFSMSLGRLDAVRDPDCLVVTAERDSRAEALLVFVPWGTDAASLDLMRRSPEADSGVNELMISRTVEAAPSLGITRISLNFAVFRDAIERSERIGAGPATRAWGRMLRAVSRWSQADTLYRFNAKFRPTWEPRFLAYQTATGLPRVAVAYLDAESLIRIPRWSFGRSGRVESARDLSTSPSGPDDGTSYRPRSPDTEETR